MWTAFLGFEVNGNTMCDEYTKAKMLLTGTFPNISAYSDFVKSYNHTPMLFHNRARIAASLLGIPCKVVSADQIQHQVS
jgi:hypothetical protein